MKNKVVIWFVLAALLISLIPVSVFAAEPMELKVFVRNSTGAAVDLRLTDANGDFHYMTLDPGVYEVELMEGKYEYYAVTTCGVQVGVWNLNVSKQLMVSCDDGVLSMDLAKRCDNGWWGVIYYDSINDLHFYSEKDYFNVAEGYYDWDIYSYFGYWPRWEKSEPVCWSEIHPYYYSSWDYIWYDWTEW